MAVYLRTLDGRQIGYTGEHQPIDCFRCGLCCIRFQPPVDSGEIRTLAEGLSLPVNRFAARYIQMTVAGYLVRRNESGCLFLSRDTASGLYSCAVHRFRPDACQNWEAGLHRRECRAGLAHMKCGGNILLPAELYPTTQAVDSFARSLREAS